MLSEKELAKLVERTKAGDMDAFGSLYRETNRRVYFICLHFMKERQEAEDMMQEAYLAAFKGLKELREPERFRGWVEQIAVNRCKNRLGKKLPIPMEEETSGVLKEESENFLPEEYVTNQEKRRIVLDIMRENLSDIQYQTVLLYYFNNLTVEEIAELMECPSGTVKYRLSVSRSKIKKGVETYEHKTHDKLYSFAGVPFLALLLSEEAKACEVPELTEQVMGAVRELGAGAGTQTARAGAANSVGAQLTDVEKDAGNAAAEAAKETVDNAAKGSTNGAAKAVTEGTADNVIGTAGKEMGKMAAKGFLSSTAAKIAIGAAVVVVGAGAAAAVIHHNQQSKEETSVSMDAGNSQGGQASGGESAAAGQSAESARAESAADDGVNPMMDGVSAAGTDTAGMVQETIEAGGAESKYDESMKGRVEGTSYINDYFGFWADLDKNWELKDYDATVAGTSLAKKTFTELLADYNHLTIFNGTNYSGGDDMGFFWVQIADEANYDTEFAQEIVPENVKEARFRRQVTHVASTPWFSTREDIMYLGTVECGDLKGFYYIHEEVEYDGSPNITEDIFLFDNNICVRINISPRSYGVENIEQLRERLSAIEEHLPLKNRVETDVITERMEEQ